MFPKHFLSETVLIVPKRYHDIFLFDPNSGEKCVQLILRPLTGGSNSGFEKHIVKVFSSSDFELVVSELRILTLVPMEIRREERHVFLGLAPENGRVVAIWGYVPSGRVYSVVYPQARLEYLVYLISLPIL